MQSHLKHISPNKVKNEKETHPGDASLQVKEEVEFFKSSSTSHSENSNEKPLGESPLDDEEDDEVQIIEHEDYQYSANAQNQLVVYNPEANGTSQVEDQTPPTEPEPAEYRTPSSYQTCLSDFPPARVLPSVGAFTVQCANCFKWRLIPTKEKYEEIRESILQQPFICERAREWRPDISCDDPADISQDGSRLWAIDKPNIAQPPPGWERLLRIRGEGSTKFADVYYATPSGKRLRSMVEIQKYLLEHPEYIRAGVTLSQFSFQIPKPLQENYVRKRPARADLMRALEPAEVNPLSWAGPYESPELQIGYSGGDDVTPPPAKRQASRSPSKHMYSTSSSNPVYNETGIKMEKPQASGNSPCDL